MVKILHFADAHINTANYGRQDPDSGLPMRVIDFLNALDKIIDAAIEEQVDMVIFAGDAYKDRNPAPTFEREWGRRIMRLANANIPAILLVGNHDLSPGLGRAHALEEFSTLEINKVIVADKPAFYAPNDLWDLPVQVISIPWISRSGMVAHMNMALSNTDELYQELESRLGEMIDEWLAKADPKLPVILTAHASIQGAVYGGERMVMLGKDLVLSGGLVKDQRLDYVAMGHIHKHQNLNEGKHPPVVYSGSIERVDWGEAKEDKFFVIAEVDKGSTEVQWCKIEGIRKFVDRFLRLESDENVNEQLRKIMPTAAEIEDSIVRLTIEFPRHWDALIDESLLQDLTRGAFEFHLVKRPQIESRIRIPEGGNVGSLSPEDLLDLYWKSAHTESIDPDTLMSLARQIIEKVEGGEEIDQTR